MMLEKHQDLVPPHIIQEIASAYELEEPRLDTGLPREGLGYLTFRMATPSGDLALRRKKGSGLKIVAKHPDIGSRIERQNALILFLHERGFPVAPPLLTKHGRTYLSVLGVPYSLHKYVNGHQMDLRNPSQVSEAGRKLATFHLLTAQYRGAPPFVQDSVPRMFELGFEEFRVNAERLNGSLNGFGLRETMQSFRESAQDIEAGLKTLPYDTLPQTIIHGDYTPQNLLFSSDELAAVLDYGRTRKEARILDLAITIHSLMKTKDPRAIQDELQTFATAYSSAIALEEAERKALPLLTQVVVALKTFKRVRRMAKKKDPARRQKNAHKFGLFAQRLQWLRDNSAIVGTLLQESSLSDTS